VNQAVGGLVQTIRDYSDGSADIKQLSEAYKKAVGRFFGMCG